MMGIELSRISETYEECDEKYSKDVAGYDGIRWDVIEIYFREMIEYALLSAVFEDGKDPKEAFDMILADAKDYYLCAADAARD